MPICESQQLRCSTGLGVMCTARGGAWEGFLMFQRMPPATHLRQILEGVSTEIFCESSGRPRRDLGTLQQGRMELHAQHSGRQCHHYTSQCRHCTMGIERVRRNCQWSDWIRTGMFCPCLLYTSDAADEEDSVDL